MVRLKINDMKYKRINKTDRLNVRSFVLENCHTELLLNRYLRNNRPNKWYLKT